MSIYLRRSNWRELPGGQPNAFVFVHSGTKKLEVAVPKDNQYTDYADRMDQALQEIAMVEKRIALEVLEDVWALNEGDLQSTERKN